MAFIPPQWEQKYLRSLRHIVCIPVSVLTRLFETIQAFSCLSANMLQSSLQERLKSSHFLLSCSEPMMSTFRPTGGTKAASVAFKRPARASVDRFVHICVKLITDQQNFRISVFVCVLKSEDLNRPRPMFRASQRPLTAQIKVLIVYSCR